MAPSRAQPDLTTYAGRFGAHIRAIRERKKLTQEQVAIDIGTTHVALTLWESGKRFPKVEMIPLLAKALQLKNVKDLFPN